MRLHDSEEALALVVSAVARDWADGGDWAFAAGGAGAICSNGFNQTVFHAPTPPATDIATYVGRIIAYAGASRVVYVAALAYIARAIAGPFGDILQLTSFNIHRMMFAACLIATKYFDDQYMTNRYYADIGGISLEEANILEVAMLRALNWDCSLSVEQLFDFENSIIQAACRSSSGSAVCFTLLNLGFRNIPLPEPTPQPSPTYSPRVTHQVHDIGHHVHDICQHPPVSVPSPVQPRLALSTSFCSNGSLSGYSVEESDGCYSHFSRNVSPAVNDSAIVAWRYQSVEHSNDEVYIPTRRTVRAPPPHHVQQASYDPFSWNTPWLPAACYTNTLVKEQACINAPPYGRVIVG